MRQDTLVHKLQNGESVYILDDYEEVALRIIPNKSGTNVYIKYRGNEETEISFDNEIACHIILEGVQINDVQYYLY